MENERRKRLQQDRDNRDPATDPTPVEA